MDFREKMLDNVIRHNKSKSKNSISLKANKDRLSRGGSMMNHLRPNQNEEGALPDVTGTDKNFNRVGTYKVGDVVQIYMSSNHNKFNELIKKKSMHKKNTLTIDTQPTDVTNQYFINNNSKKTNTQPGRGLSSHKGNNLNNYTRLKTNSGINNNHTPIITSRAMTLNNDIPDIVNHFIKDNNIIKIVNNTNNNDAKKIDLKMNINKYDIKYYVGSNEIPTNAANMSDMSINVDIEDTSKNPKDAPNNNITEPPKLITINKALYKLNNYKDDLLITNDIKDDGKAKSSGDMKILNKMNTLKEHKSKSDLPNTSLHKALSLNLKKGMKLLKKLNTIKTDNKDESLNEGKKFSEIKIFPQDLTSPVNQEKSLEKINYGPVQDHNPNDNHAYDMNLFKKRGTFLSSDSIYLGKGNESKRNFDEIEKEFYNNEPDQTSSNASNASRSRQSITYSYNKTPENMSENEKQELLINSDIKEIFPQVGKKEILGSHNELKFTTEESPMLAKKKFQSELHIHRGFNRKTTIENRPQIFTPELKKEILKRHSIINPSVFNLFSEKKSKEDKRHTLFPTHEFDEIILNESIEVAGFSEEDESKEDNDKKVSTVLNKNEDDEIKLIQTETNKIRRKKELTKRSLLMIQTLVDDKFNESDKQIKRKKLINFYKNGFYYLHFNDILNENNQSPTEVRMKLKRKNFDIDIKLAPYVNEKYLSMYNEMIFQNLYKRTYTESPADSLLNNFSLIKGHPNIHMSFDVSNRNRNPNFDIGNHLFINGFIMRDCKGNFNNLSATQTENTYKKYFNQKTGVRLLNELEELRRFSLFDTNQFRRSIKKKNRREGYESETIDNEESLKAIEGDNNIRTTRKKRTEDEKKRKFKLEMGKIAYKLQEFTVLKSKMFFERQSTDHHNLRVSSKEKSKQMQRNVKVYSTRCLPISKENTALRTHEIKTRSIKTSTSNSFETLAFYIKDGDWEKFHTEFERHKVPVNQTDGESNSMLNLAAQCGNMKMIQFLLERGADPNLQNKTLNAPLHYALSHHNFNIANLLLKFGANEELPNKHGQTPWQCVNSIRKYS